MKVTIRDVARRAGVSPATVSRVLNKPELVEPETKERVRGAIEELDFQPSAIARGLSVQRTDTIGLVVPGITDLFFGELYRGIDRASHESGMKVLLFDAQHARHRAFEGFTFLRQHRVGGIIFTSKVVSEDYDPVLERIGIPVVLALTEATGRTALPAFKVDDVKAVFDAVAYLVSRGHTRVGMITGDMSDDLTGDLRLQGYRAGLEHYGIPYQSNWVETGDYRFTTGYQAMRRLLEHQDQNQLTAVCAASDEMAIGAIRCLHDHGLKVPDDFSVMGFDDLGVAHMTVPALTTIAQPFAEIGERAVQQLVQMIADDTIHASGTYYLPHRIVERESVRALSDLR
ncbi:LacI family DNA-binding transcriptional regulator [Alicyclobacillus sp. ALC3]|uniref:LacI family DNA-binding transcriptional regulator n=1 Tax=Alicyclobacillus sp. ALC3 TaxID=2796143 RepID=UPI0023798DD2|nr:LacI family DNA-binding transcriptional regulator [Alicyclobacillus sp. ALC3]WDL95532.1 LacI family DNA-binding transcriptional regulator [Alicyclobacillus sp. ALC3]